MEDVVGMAAVRRAIANARAVDACKQHHKTQPVTCHVHSPEEVVHQARQDNVNQQY